MVEPSAGLSAKAGATAEGLPRRYHGKAADHPGGEQFHTQNPFTTGIMETLTSQNKTAARRTPGAQAPEAAHPIGRLAREAGVSTRTIRYYEEIGLLKTARRYAGGRRVFQADALERLRFIGRLKRLGFSLEEISTLNEVFELHASTSAMLKVLDGQLAGHIEAVDRQMADLEGLRKDLETYRRRIQKRIGK